MSCVFFVACVLLCTACGATTTNVTLCTLPYINTQVNISSDWMCVYAGYHTHMVVICSALTVGMLLITCCCVCYGENWKAFAYVTLLFFIHTPGFEVWGLSVPLYFIQEFYYCALDSRIVPEEEAVQTV
jgi:hypothetical protein